MKKVIIVDQDVNFASSLSESLNARGYTTVTFKSFPSTLLSQSLESEEKPDLLVIGELPESPRPYLIKLNEIPLVIFSDVDIHTTESILKLEKPIEPSQVALMIEYFLKDKKSI